MAAKGVYEKRAKFVGGSGRWTDWDVEPASPWLDDALAIRERQKITIHLPTAKVQWRRKP